MENCTIKWYRFNDAAKVPVKDFKAAGFDIYTTEPITIPPHCCALLPTGLGMIISDGWWFMAFDRGSTGSKGLHVHCGVIDNDYRGEIFICLENTNDYPAVIGDFTKAEVTEDKKGKKELHYPISKGIAQLIPVPQPSVSTRPCSQEEWDKSCEESKRGSGKLGSSGK